MPTSLPRRYLVHHSMSLVSQDLRETLEAAGPCVVEVVSALGQAPQRCYDAAFVNTTSSELASNPAIAWLLEKCGMIVALNSDPADPEPAPGKVVVLPQPFRSQDVLDVLAKVGWAMGRSV